MMPSTDDGEISPLSAVHTASSFQEVRSVQSHTKCRRLFLAHPAIINPDRKETKKTGTEIPGRSVEIIHSRFNNTKTQDVWILLADE
jgi:hypothetical protein